MKRLLLVIMVMILGTSLIACGKTEIETVEEKSFVDMKLEDIQRDTDDLRAIVEELGKYGY